MAAIHDAVWQIANDALGNSFPDGDPIDEIIPKLNRMGYYDYRVGEMLDESFEVREGKSWHKYLHDFWADAVSDFDDNYRMELFGTTTPVNPWPI